MPDKDFSPLQCELEAIAYDVICFHGFVEAVSRHPNSANIILGAIPYISLFVIESCDTLSAYFPDHRDLFKTQHEKFIRASRHRIKLLFSKGRALKIVADELGTIAIQHREHFNKFHAELSEPYQPNLGLTTYDGHIFSTTHVTVFNFGSPSNDNKPVSIEELSSLVPELSMELGAYISFVNTFLNLPKVNFIYSEVALPGDMLMMDIEAEDLLARGVIGYIEPNYPAGLTAILAHVNYTLFILRRLLPAAIPTLFKLKFLCAYHAETSLRVIARLLHRKGNPSEKTVDIFKSALGNEDARWLRKQKQLRNFLMHYQLDTHSRKASSSDATYRETIEALLKDRAFQEVDVLLDRYLDTLSQTLEDGFQLSGDTFSYGRVT